MSNTWKMKDVLKADTFDLDPVGRVDDNTVITLMFETMDDEELAELFEGMSPSEKRKIQNAILTL